jgi:Tn3 transposase DDE domain
MARTCRGCSTCPDCARKVCPEGASTVASGYICPLEFGTGEVCAYDLIRMMSRDGHPTGLGEAFAHYGRIFKTLHLLQVVHDESYRGG